MNITKQVEVHDAECIFNIRGSSFFREDIKLHTIALRCSACGHWITCV